MSARIIAGGWAVVWLAGAAGLAAAQDADITERFALVSPTDSANAPNAGNILGERDFGIADGHLTAGIDYQDLVDVSGLWAPPYVSSDFHLRAKVLDSRVATARYEWRPWCVERAGSIEGKQLALESTTMLAPAGRAGIVAVTVRNLTGQPQTVPLAFTVAGTLDRIATWEFAAPQSRTPTTRKRSEESLILEQGEQAIVLRASPEIRWDAAQSSGQGTVALPPSGSARVYVAFAVGPSRQAAEECKTLAAAPQQAIAAARAAYAKQVQDLFGKLPRLESSNPSLVRLYDRSLVAFLMNRWDVPEFVLHPYYSTGSVKGGCVCNYLWNFGEIWEILPLFDPDAARTHTKAFLAADMTAHFALDPMTGKAFGPWYPVNQEKIVGMIYYYVRNTGDTAFLNETVAGKTVLEHVLAHATYGDDLAGPVALIDYRKAGNSHLELRIGRYEQIMPDLNGRRYANYVMAAELAEVAGRPQPQLRRRAEELKALLKRTLWNPRTRWFDFQYRKNPQDAGLTTETRYTVQMFKLLAGGVLDAEEESGLLGHLNETEFLSEFGLHSLSKTDPVFDPADVDNGGPGCCTGFPPQIAERLYKAGRATPAEDILRRILWWGQRMPYWGDSIEAGRAMYRTDTPLQCTIDAAAMAQCVLFGMFGVRAEFNGDLRVDPRPPAFAPRIALKGLRIRGRVLDISVQGDAYEVQAGSEHIRSPVGTPVLLQGDRLIRGPRLPGRN